MIPTDFYGEKERGAVIAFSKARAANWGPGLLGREIRALSLARDESRCDVQESMVAAGPKSRRSEGAPNRF